MDPILVALAMDAGIHFMGTEAMLQLPNVAHSIRVAMDAQPALITTSNAGIPAFLSTYIDPKLIEILVAPMKAAEIVGEEVKKGDWTTDTAMFPVVESTGETSSYGDYSNNGVAGANTNFPQRQSYHYQVITQWGEKELAKAALAKIDWANRVNIASVLTLNKFQNKTYFYGVAGLQNYGLLNDPSLYAPIAPTVETGGLITWNDKDALGIYADILQLFKQLQIQTGNTSLVEMDAKMTLALSSGVAPNLGKVTQYNVNVRTMIKDNFPNLRIETAPEYSTAAGNLVQMFVDEVEGQRTVDVAFTEKLRAHPIVIEMSAFRQKKSQGTFGAIVYRPMFIAAMLGV
jgi:hypothetical protein